MSGRFWKAGRGDSARGSGLGGSGELVEVIQLGGSGLGGNVTDEM